jgi:hypothetical protein
MMKIEVLIMPLIWDIIPICSIFILLYETLLPQNTFFQTTQPGWHDLHQYILG